MTKTITLLLDGDMNREITASSVKAGLHNKELDLKIVLPNFKAIATNQFYRVVDNTIYTLMISNEESDEIFTPYKNVTQILDITNQVLSVCEKLQEVPSDHITLLLETQLINDNEIPSSVKSKFLALTENTTPNPKIKRPELFPLFLTKATAIAPLTIKPITNLP